MYVCNGRFCILEELTTNNEDELLKMMLQYSNEYRRTVSDETVPISLNVFKEKLDMWFKSGRNYQFLVYNKKQHISGTIFLYGWNKRSRTTKYSCFFIPSERRGLLVAESLGLVTNFAFHFMNIESIYFDVYENNYEMQKLAHKIGGKKLNHRKSAINKDRVVISYLLSRNTLEQILGKLKRLERR